MACAYHLYTNNPVFFDLERKGLVVCAVEGTANDVLIAARDKVHSGWRMLNHPLYGNFRPGHQPFRSILLEEAGGGVVDAFSLDLVEQALGVYRACADRAATPQSVSAILFRDCSRIDQALMQATLDQYTGA